MRSSLSKVVIATSLAFAVTANAEANDYANWLTSSMVGGFIGYEMAQPRVVVAPPPPVYYSQPRYVVVPQPVIAPPPVYYAPPPTNYVVAPPAQIPVPQVPVLPDAAAPYAAPDAIVSDSDVPAPVVHTPSGEPFKYYCPTYRKYYPYTPVCDVPWLRVIAK